MRRVIRVCQGFHLIAATTAFGVEELVLNVASFPGVALRFYTRLLTISLTG